VLTGVGAIIVPQLLFTYLPPMQGLFDTRAVALTDGLIIIAVGIALLSVLEVESASAGHCWRAIGSAETCAEL
jgi:hypothetical protein